MSNNVARYLRWLLIILLGNGLYYACFPYLPLAARHQGFNVDLGTLVIAWFVLIVFGIFELVAFLQSNHGKTGQS